MTNEFRFLTAVPLRLAVLLVIVCPVVAAAQIGVTTIYVEEVTSPSEFTSKRFHMLFEEQFSEIENIQIVDKRESADYVAQGLGDVGTNDATVFIPTLGVTGNVTNAVASLRLVELSTDIVHFVGNEEKRGANAAEDAVEALVDDLKDHMDWD